MRPTLSEEDVLERVGDRSFEHGEDYYRHGAIYDARRQGTTLKARCQGSRSEAYRLSVTLGPSGIASADCSCPVGGGGYCKHVAALLLAWINHPDDFREVADLDAGLAARSKGELIALIKQMLLREPDLEVLLEPPLPVPGEQRAPVDAEIYRRQAAAAFRSAGYDDYDAGGNVAAELDPIVAIAEGFADQGDAVSAYRVYESVLSQVCENYETFQDEEGELARVAQDCVAGLGQCLELVGDDAATREAILRALVDSYYNDLVWGGVGLADAVPAVIEEHASPDERRMVARWVRGLIDKDGPGRSDWTRQALGGFLIDLELEALDNEEFIRICRETGRTHDLVQRLLDLGRLDEAIAAIKSLSNHAVLGMSTLFETHGHGNVIEEILVERSREDDIGVLTWLMQRSEARGDDQLAVDLAERIFRAVPSMNTYRDLRDRSQRVGDWETRHPALLAFLDQAKRTDILVQVHLDEVQIDRALELVPRLMPTAGLYGFNYYGLTGDLVLSVAKAAELTRPRAALEIYRQRAEKLIELRGRDNYKAACGLLRKVCTIYQDLGEESAWSDYVTALRERTRALRALKEEMATAGL